MHDIHEYFFRNERKGKSHRKWLEVTLTFLVSSFYPNPTYPSVLISSFVLLKVLFSSRIWRHVFQMWFLCWSCSKTALHVLFPRPIWLYRFNAFVFCVEQNVSQFRSAVSGQFMEIGKVLMSLFLLAIWIMTLLWVKQILL